MWCPDDRYPHVRADTHRDHVLCHRFAASHASVKTPSDDVDQPVVDDDLDFDIRKLPQDLRQFWKDDRVGGIFGP